MAGHGVLPKTHALLETFAPDRFEASDGALLACFDAIDEGIAAYGERERTPALAHGIGKVLYLREMLAGEDRRLPNLLIWDDLNHELTHNLGGLGLTTEGSK